MRRFSPWLLALLAACAQPVPVVDETSTPPLPSASYAAAARSGSAVYRIAPEESLILVGVKRDGAMKRLGHDHAIASEEVQGFVELHDDSAASRADIVLPLRNLLIDNPVYRQQLALDTDPSAADVAGTYTNMLKVLEPILYPWVAAHARIVSGQSNSPTLSVSITMHGTVVDYLMPVELEVNAARLVVRGRAIIRHSEFGMSPYSAAGGLLRVADELEIVFHLVGKRLATQ